MEKIDNMRCYFAGEIQRLRMHFIMTYTMRCVLTELDLITSPKNFAVRKPHDAFCLGTNYCKIVAVTNFQVGGNIKKK